MLRSLKSVRSMYNYNNLSMKNKFDLKLNKFVFCKIKNALILLIDKELTRQCFFKKT